MEAEQGLEIQHTSGDRCGFAQSAAVLQIFQILGGEEDAAAAADLFQQGHGLLQRQIPVPQADGLLDEQTFQSGYCVGIHHMDLSARIKLLDAGLGIYGRLQGTAEFMCQTDAQYRQTGFDMGDERIHVVLNGGHGGFGEAVALLDHQLIEVGNRNINALAQIVVAVHGNIIGDDIDLLFLGESAG